MTARVTWPEVDATLDKSAAACRRRIEVNHVVLTRLSRDAGANGVTIRELEYEIALDNNILDILEGNDD